MTRKHGYLSGWRCPNCGKGLREVWSADGGVEPNAYSCLNSHYWTIRWDSEIGWSFRGTGRPQVAALDIQIKPFDGGGETLFEVTFNHGTAMSVSVHLTFNELARLRRIVGLTILCEEHKGEGPDGEA